MTHVLRFELFPSLASVPSLRTEDNTEVAVVYTHHQVFPTPLVETVARKTLTFLLTRWFDSTEDNIDFQIDLSALNTYLERLGDSEHSNWILQFNEATARRTIGANGTTIWITYK